MSTIVVSSSQRAVRVPKGKLVELALFVAQKEGVSLAAVDIAVVTSDQIAGMNKSYLNHRGPTDVLSFDLSDSSRPGISAQIVVCGDVAAEQAAARGLTPRRELMLYVTHGLLHLMGYEDHSIRGAARMHAREDEILDEFIPKKRKTSK